MSDQRFADKVVIISGGASGIGAGCAEVFHRAGGNIGIIDRDQAGGERMADRLNSLRSGSADFVCCDVGQREQLTDAIGRLKDRWGRLHCLINNAGIHPPDTPIDQTDDQLLDQVFRINFTSTFVASRVALPFLRETKGTIVNMSSMTAVLGQRNSTAYSASKGAQLSLTRSLALEAADSGVRVNAVLPGNVDTPLMQSWAATLPDPAAALSRIAALQPLGRMASAEEIGKVCLFLASDDSSFITGQGIEVDGGASLDY
jgi:NAD(P)-dependent dehydrogenase (short-subunit alcohol dehydrogenase family)